MQEEIVRVSTKGQLVLPSDIRENLHIRKGTSMVVVVQRGLVIMKPIRSLSQLQGIMSDVKGKSEEIVKELRKEWDIKLSG